MMNRALLSAIVLCFAAVGCDSQKTAEPPKPKAAQVVVPMPGEAPKAPAASAGQDAKPMQAVQGSAPGVPKSKKPACKNNNNCTVELEVTGTANPNCMIIKSDDKLFVARGSPEKIKWRIKTNGWEFDTNGIAFTNAQFKCGPQGNHYECDDPNKETKPTDFPYTIALKKGTAKCSVDPMIVNGADDEN